MDVSVKRIINRPVDSNCYVLYKPNNSDCIVIDPGTDDSKELLDFLYRNKLKPTYIILTHEHFDHIWGVNKLKNIFNSKIVCSRDCSTKIIDKKKNMSVFYNQSGFKTNPADIQIEDVGNKMNWKGFKIEFISTKGHTSSSICIQIGNFLFTGDTLIKNKKTITKLPSGSRADLMLSLNYLDQNYSNKKIRIFPGHGDDFLFEGIKNKGYI